MNCVKFNSLTYKKRIPERKLQMNFVGSKSEVEICFFLNLISDNWLASAKRLIKTKKFKNMSNHI